MKTIKECQLEINENSSFPLKEEHAYLQALKDILKLIDEFLEDVAGELDLKSEGYASALFDLKQKIQGK